MSYQWKKACNYWRRTDENGNSINTIKVDGVEVVVSEAVYTAYASMGRKERYAYEREQGKVLSLERMQDDELLLGYLSPDACESSAENTYLDAEQARGRKRLRKMMSCVLSELSQPEQELIRLLYWEERSVRDAAKRLCMDESAVRYRRNRLLAKLKKLLRKT